MRYYNNRQDPTPITGFASPCEEFSENRLSLDERYNIGNPAIVMMFLNEDYPKLGLYKGDLLLIDRSLRPRFADLIVIEDRVYKIGAMTEFEDQVVLGVITTAVHHFC